MTRKRKLAIGILTIPAVVSIGLGFFGPNETRTNFLTWGFLFLGVPALAPIWIQNPLLTVAALLMYYGILAGNARLVGNLEVNDLLDTISIAGIVLGLLLFLYEGLRLKPEKLKEK